MSRDYITRWVDEFLPSSERSLVGLKGCGIFDDGLVVLRRFKVFWSNFGA